MLQPTEVNMHGIKHDVKLAGLQPQMVLAYFIACGVYSHHGVNCVMTSGVEGKHGEFSRHYLGFAIDTRKRDFLSGELQTVLKDLRHHLGPEFYVRLEGNHFHISYKPRRVA